MNVSLTPELEQFVDDQVSTGRYRSASEFVRECIRARMEIEEEKAAKLQALRRLIDEGLESLATAGVIPGDEAYARLLEQLRR